MIIQFATIALILADLFATEFPGHTKLAGHDGLIVSMAFSPNGQILATGGNDCEIILWDVGRGKIKATLEKQPGAVLYLGFSPNSKFLASGTFERTGILWDGIIGKKLRVLEHNGTVTSGAFTADSKRLITASRGRKKQLTVWDSESGQELQAFSAPNRGPNCLALSPDDVTVVTAEGDRIAITDIEKKKQHTISVGENNTVWACAFSPNGKSFLTADDKGIVTLWDSKTRETLGTLIGHQGAVTSVAFSPDGGTIATGSDDKSVRLWDAKLRKTIAKFTIPNSVGCIAFGPGADHLAIGSVSEILIVKVPRVTKR